MTKTDIFDADKRSQIMSRVRSKDSKIERLVRSELHKLGYRFRLHRKDLPGNPDIVLPKYRTVIFVHGCFWHQHSGCKRATIPKHNVDFWAPKLERNVKRDHTARQSLDNLGWKVVTMWQCEINTKTIKGKLLAIMDEVKEEAGYKTMNRTM